MATVTQPPRNPTSCRRGPAADRPRLYLPRSSAASSVLVLKIAPGHECQVEVPPRFTGVLLALVDAWQLDEGDVETNRGFLSAAELGTRYAEFSDTGDTIAIETVRAYVSGLSRHVVDTVSARFPHKRIDRRALALIEPRRGLGYRIKECGLEVVPPRPRVVSGH
jgi:hypothetical protein